MKAARAIAIGLACLVPFAADAADTVKVGLLTTFSGPGGLLGKHQKDGVDLALAELGGKLGGLPAEIIDGDDQQKPDIGRQVVDGMLKRDGVKFVTGVVFSNVLLAVQKPIEKAGAILVSASGGPSELAGKDCSADFFSASWQNDQAAEAMGSYLDAQKVDSVVILAPNYAAGKDMLAGFKRNFKGKVLGEIYTNFAQADYQPELSQIRSLNPKAVFVFYPGGLGIQFVKQYAQAGLKGAIPLYSVYTQNETTLAALGAAAEGNYEAGFWSPDLKNEANVAFVAAFEKKYGYTPSEYAASAYDAIKLIDSGLRATGGKLGDNSAIVKGLEKADIRSVRGEFKFNTNHFPIQDFYLFHIEKQGGSAVSFPRTVKVISTAHGDSYAADCAMK